MVEFGIKSKQTEGITNLLRLPASKTTEKKLIVSERVGYLYCELDEIEEVVNLDELLLDLLSAHNGLTRRELVHQTCIPRTTIYDVLKKLMKEDKVSVEHLRIGRRGRPWTIFKVNQK